MNYKSYTSRVDRGQAKLVRYSSWRLVLMPSEEDNDRRQPASEARGAAGALPWQAGPSHVHPRRNATNPARIHRGTRRSLAGFSLLSRSFCHCFTVAQWPGLTKVSAALVAPALDAARCSSFKRARLREAILLRRRSSSASALPHCRWKFHRPATP